jgi:hypothetical protein
MKPTLLRTAALLMACSMALVAPPAQAADKSVDLGGGKSVTFNLPSTWEIVAGEVPADLASLGKTIQLSPKNGANAVCSISLFVPPDNHFADHDALKEALQTSGERYAADTVEGKVTPREFKTPHAFGYSATFTDKTMVGKPIEHGSYKVAAIVVLYLPEQIVVTATVLCDDPAGPDFAAMMTLLRSLAGHSAANNI